MISALIFFLHIIFALVIFTKKWQNENLKSGFLNLGLIAVLFAVGWSITGIIAKALMAEKGFGLYFDRDTFSLGHLFGWLGFRRRRLALFRLLVRT